MISNKVCAVTMETAINMWRECRREVISIPGYGLNLMGEKRKYNNLSWKNHNIHSFFALLQLNGDLQTSPQPLLHLQQLVCMKP
jgi:hypothetical protein